VPRISEFSGVIVYMYVPDHPPPHCHVRYGGEWAKVSLTGKVIKGRLPRLVLSRVRRWIMEYRDELVRNWERAEEGRAPKEVPPP
jgi:hypothetical protein